MKLVRLFLFIAFFGSLFWQCAQDDFFLSNQNAVQIKFASIYTGNDTTLGKFTAYGLGRADSLIYDSVSTQTAFLPLRFDIDTTAFIIQNYSMRDTIVFSHTKEPYYVSADDGFTYNLSIEKVTFTENFIYNISVLNSGVNYNESDQNVKIYIR